MLTRDIELGESEDLQLTVENWVKWLLSEGLLTEEDVIENPELVEDLKEEHYESFQEDMFEAYATMIEDQRMRWGYE